MTIRTGFIQKDIFKAIKMSVTADEGSEGDVSQFGALTTALSSTIGTGNIIGVGTAIAMGGPGSVFWMWMTAMVGMAMTGRLRSTSVPVWRSQTSPS